MEDMKIELKKALETLKEKKNISAKANDSVTEFRLRYSIGWLSAAIKHLEGEDPKVTQAELEKDSVANIRLLLPPANNSIKTPESQVKQVIAKYLKKK